MAAKKTSAPAKAKRRSPITRQEGERRLIAAAKELMCERPFSEVGVRDIAARADVNHGFVHVWFGSKNLLFIAVRNQIINDLSGDLRQDSEAELGMRLQSDRDAILLARLTAWLELEGAEGIETTANGPMVNSIAERYMENYGLEGEAARTAARHILSLGVTGIVAGRTLNISEHMASIIEQWQHMLRLLAADQKA